MQTGKLQIGNAKYYLLICMITAIVYWPLSFHVFSLKNDALSYFLPYRYHVSEAIRHGSFPFWSPYLYTGLPLHADIQSGAWNPVVLLISLVKHYDMRILQWETLLYLMIGGIGFFKLGRFFGFRKDICLLLAISYACSGFMIDSGSFIPWITSAAYLPFVFLFYLKLSSAPSADNAILLALSSAFLFLAGYSSFFIITFYILFFSFIVQLVRYYRQKNKPAAMQWLKWSGLSAVVALIICSPALLSYIEFFPYYARGKGAGLDAAQINPFVIDNSISYLFPPSSYRLFTPNDISSRNAYIGIIPVLFLIYSLRYGFNRYQNVITGLTILFFLFSLGDATPMRALFYYILPFMDSFRHPGTVRLFTGTGLLLLAGFGLQAFLRYQNKKFLNRIIVAFLILALLFTGYNLFFSNGMGEIASALERLEWNGRSVKAILDTSGFPFWLVISGLIQILFLAAFLVNKKPYFLVYGSILNMMVMAFLCLPFTLISKNRTGEARAFQYSFPRGFPPDLAWEQVEDRINDPELLTTFGYRNFYTKRISIQDHIISPTVNEAYGEFLKDTALRQKISRHRFAFFDRNDSVLLAEFRPNAFSFITVNTSPNVLHLTQQFHHNWKAKADNISVPIERDHKAFMKISVPAGTSVVRFSYRPMHIIIAMILALAAMLGCIGWLAYFSWIKR